MAFVHDKKQMTFDSSIRMVIKMIQTRVEVEDQLPEIFTHPKRYEDFKYIGGGSFGKVV